MKRLLAIICLTVSNSSPLTALFGLHFLFARYAWLSSAIASWTSSIKSGCSSTLSERFDGSRSCSGLIICTCCDLPIVLISSICRWVSWIAVSWRRICSTAILNAGSDECRFNFANASSFSYGVAVLLKRMSFKFRTLTCFSCVPILTASEERNPSCI